MFYLTKIGHGAADGAAPACKDCRLLMKKHPKYRFPWCEGNRFRLLVDGEQFFPRMLEAIAAARRHILLEMYLFESGTVANRFIEALSEAAARGVAVYVLLDDFGARGLYQKDRARLAQHGVHLAFYNPLRYGQLRRNLFRDHRKLLVVDAEVAFTGGAGITDAFQPPHHAEQSWHETMVEIHGPNVADWQALFEENWGHWSTQPLAAPQQARGALAGTQIGRVTATGGPTRAEIKRSFVRRTRGAERLVWISTAYFVPSWKLLRVLRHTARRGADVRLLLPGPYTDHPAVRHAGRRFYARLLRNGVRIFEYQPRFLHAKILLCDHWVSIGSSNVDRWNLRWNLEANQEIEDMDFATEVQALFEADFEQSQEYHYGEWRQRSWYQHLLERFWGAVDLWMEQRAQRRAARTKRRRRAKKEPPTDSTTN